MLSGIWRRRPNAGTTQDGTNPDTAVMTMTEDAKAEKYTAGNLCGIKFGNLLKSFQNIILALR